MINRLMKGFIVVSLGFVFGCTGFMQKTKRFIQSPSGKQEETSERMAESSKENHIEKGKNLFMKGKMKSALKEFEEAARTDTDSPEVHYNMGLTYYELNRYSEAIKEYKKAIQLKPDLAEAHFNLGVAYDQSGQTKNALQSYKVAMNYGIDDAAIHFNMGLSFLKLSRLNEAKKELLKALDLEPNLAEAYNNLGYLDEAAGDLDLAITRYKKALAIRPDYKLARENLERLVKIPAAPERPPISKKKLLSQLFFEADGKFAFTQDIEIETPIGKKEISSNYQSALFRFGYRPVKKVDLFIDLGVTNLSFDDKFPIFDINLTRYDLDFKKIIGLCYGAGIDAEIYHWDSMNLSFDTEIEFLMGSNKRKLEDGRKAVTDWHKYTISLKTRYLGLNNLVPYGGFSFSKLNGTFELNVPGLEIQDEDYNESTPFGIFLGGSYYIGEHLRLQTEAKFINETSLAFGIKYSF